MKINLGSGIRDGLKAGSDWLNIDVHSYSPPDNVNYLQWDLRKGLPTECDGADGFANSHFLEHMTIPDAELLLTRCFKVLKPGGFIQCGIPNFDGIFRAYLDNDLDYLLPPMFAFAPNRTWAEIMTYAIFNSEDDPHKSFWNVNSTIWLLTKIGFKNVKEVPFDSELDVDTELRRRYTKYIKGWK